MNKAVCFGIGFGVGGIISGLSTYFYMKRWADKETARRIDEFESAHHTKKKYPHFDDIPGGEIVTKEDSESDEHHTPFSKSSISDGPVDVERVAYHKMAHNYMKGDIESELGEPDEGPSDDISSEEDSVPDGSISIISVEEYEDDNTHAKVECVWYVEDDVIADNFGDEIEDWGVLFGDCLDSIKTDEFKGDECFYIRNNKVMVDYCIDVTLEGYHSEEGGVS